MKSRISKKVYQCKKGVHIEIMEKIQEQNTKKRKWLYMAITNDDYELPVYFADTSKELAKIAGVAPSTILAYVCREKHPGKYKNSDKCNRLTRMKLRYIKVELPDDDVDLMSDVPEQLSTMPQVMTNAS